MTRASSTAQRLPASSAPLSLVPPPASADGAAEAWGVLQAALDAIREPAFVVRPGEGIVECNAAGRRLLVREPEATAAKLERVKQGGSAPEGVRVTRGAGAALVVVASGASEELAERAAALWSLSPRQRQVVSLLAEGRSNRAMAAVMGVTERTIEQHLSLLYQRLEVDGRTELMAALLRL